MTKREEFIEKMVSSDMPYSDIQASVMAYAEENNEDGNALMSEIQKLISKRESQKNLEEMYGDFKGGAIEELKASENYLVGKIGVFYDSKRKIGFLPTGDDRFDVFVNGTKTEMNVSGFYGLENMEKQALEYKKIRDESALRLMEGYFAVAKAVALRKTSEKEDKVFFQNLVKEFMEIITEGRETLEHLDTAIRSRIDRYFSPRG